MTKTITIALDVMGGDDAPEIVLRGADIARERFPNVRFLLFGVEPRMSSVMASLPRLAESSRIVHTDIVVANDAKPSIALRTGRGSSMRLAIDAVARGDARAVVSAGNTGALMAVARYLLKTVDGIDRPAIATVMPHRRDGYTTVLDLGANVDCTPENLLQFAVMGSALVSAAGSRSTRPATTRSPHCSSGRPTAPPLASMRVWG
jgi:glycerol-3-phosphate acyltransferase PlsX